MPSRYQGRNGTLQNDGCLITIPENQRDYVWKEKKQRLLVDTILKGYPLPAVYLMFHRRTNSWTALRASSA